VPTCAARTSLAPTANAGATHRTFSAAPRASTRVLTNRTRTTAARAGARASPAGLVSTGLALVNRPMNSAMALASTRVPTNRTRTTAVLVRPRVPPAQPARQARANALRGRPYVGPLVSTFRPTARIAERVEIIAQGYRAEPQFVVEVPAVVSPTPAARTAGVRGLAKGEEEPIAAEVMGGARAAIQQATVLQTATVRRENPVATGSALLVIAACLMVSIAAG
jgi:hypothetical protein